MLEVHEMMLAACAHLGCRSIRTWAILQARRDDGLRTEMCQSERRAHSKYVRRTTSAQRAVCTQFELKPDRVQEPAERANALERLCVPQRRTAWPQRSLATPASARSLDSGPRLDKEHGRRSAVTAEVQRPKTCSGSKGIQALWSGSRCLALRCRLRACSSLRSQHMQHRSL